MSSKGQIVIPAELRRLNGLANGDEFEIERIGGGEYRLARQTPPLNRGLVDWLLACPEKRFFDRVESESTDDL